MPPGPLSQGAENTVSDVNTPQQPQGFGQFSQPLTPTNQVSTKPRQMPGGGGGQPPPGLGATQPGDGSNVAMNPSATGADTVPNEQQSDVGAPKQGIRHVAYVLTDVLADVIDCNPGLGEREAYLLAKRVLDEYPMLVTADMDGLGSGLGFGQRYPVADGPFTQWMYNRVHERADARAQEKHWRKHQPPESPAQDESEKDKPDTPKLEVPTQRRTRPKPVSTLPDMSDLFGDDEPKSEVPTQRKTRTKPWQKRQPVSQWPSPDDAEGQAAVTRWTTSAPTFLPFHDDEPKSTRTPAPWEDALDSALDPPKPKWGDMPSRTRGPV